MTKCKLYIIAFLLGILTFYLLRNKKNIEGYDPEEVSASAFNELNLLGVGTDIGENTSVDPSGRINTNLRNGPIRLTIKGKFDRGRITDNEDNNNLNANPQFVLSKLKEHIEKSPNISNTKIDLISIEEIYDGTITMDFTIIGLTSELNIPEILRGNTSVRHGIEPLNFYKGYYLLSEGPQIRIDYGSSEYIYKWIKTSQIDQSLKDKILDSLNLSDLSSNSDGSLSLQLPERRDTTSEVAEGTNRIELTDISDLTQGMNVILENLSENTIANVEPSGEDTTQGIITLTNSVNISIPAGTFISFSNPENDSSEINLSNFCLRRNAGTTLDQINDDNNNIDLNLDIDYEIEREADCSEKNYSLNLRTFDTTKRVIAPCRDHNRYCSTWANETLCEISDYMQENCRRSCNKCPHEEEIVILPPDVTKSIKRKHDKEINMDWQDRRYNDVNEYDNFSGYDISGDGDDFENGYKTNLTGFKSASENINNTTSMTICKNASDNFVEEKITDVDDYDMLKNRCASTCYTMLNSCRGFSTHQKSDGEKTCRFYQKCHENAERDIINESIRNSDELLNPGPNNITKIDYYYKQPLDPLMGDSLRTDLVSESLALSEQQIRDQRLSPARYDNFNLSPGTANQFVRFDDDNDNNLSSISFNRQANKVTAIDAMNGTYYECGPGSPTKNRGESICVNPNNDFRQGHLNVSAGDYLIHLEHDGDDNYIYKTSYDDTSNLTLKNNSGFMYNNNKLLGNITTRKNDNNNNTDVYASASNFQLIDGRAKKNLFCDDDLLLDDDTNGVSNKTFLDCKNACLFNERCRAFSYHNLTESDVTDNNNCRLYNTDCSDTSKLRINADENGVFRINVDGFFNNPPQLVDALDYMGLSHLKENLVGNYSGETGFTEDGKWKDVSGKNQHARINNPSNVRIVNANQNPMVQQSQAGNYALLLSAEGNTEEDSKIRSGGIKGDKKVLKGFTTHETNETYRDVASVEFPQDLTPHNYTIFYITRWGPDYDKDELKKIRVNKPWSDPTIGNDSDIFTEPPNGSDVGFNMNKGRIVTSPTKDWLSGHYGGTPYCTGTVSEGDVDPNPVPGEFESLNTNTGSYFGGLPCYQSYGVVSGAGNKGGFQGGIRSRERAEEWCAGAWNSCNFSVSGISAGASGTGAQGRGPESGLTDVQPNNGLHLYRELGHPRLGTARHDGNFFLGHNPNSNAGQPPISLTHYGIVSDITAKGDDTADNVANNIKYKQNITNFLLASDIESSIISTLPGKDVSVLYTRPSRSDEENTFKISINKPGEYDHLIKEQISQYWECAEMVIFNKELQPNEIKKIRSYLYYKYTDETESTQTNIGPNNNGNSEESRLFDKNSNELLLYNPRLQIREPLHYSTDSNLGERGKSILFKKVDEEDIVDDLGIRKFSNGNPTAQKLYKDKNIIKTSTLFERGEDDPVNNDYLYSLDNEGNIHICNPTN